MASDERFNALLKESFSSTIKEVLGETAGAALLYYVDFSKADPLASLGAMRTVIGLGSPVIERLMLRDLYDRVNLRYDEKPSLDFEVEVRRAKSMLEELTTRSEDR